MTVSFKSFGCRLNSAETVHFEAQFSAAGFGILPFGEDSAVIMLHTCAVTRRAEAECVRILRGLRQRHPNALLVVAGCAVETLALKALQEAGANLIVPRADKERLIALVLQELPLPPSRSALAPASPTAKTSRKQAPGSAAPRLTRALLKVQDGCDFFCTYCIIPHTRGAPRSIPFEDCLSEARRLIDQGHLEIVVTGCNIACYRDGTRDLITLLRALGELPGLGRLRLGSIEPGTLEVEILKLIASSDRFCRYLHLPVQSGSDTILQSMGRHYDRARLEFFLAQVEELLPNLALGADFICGFPGERAEHFDSTLELAGHFSNLHVFPYSERPGTPACDFAGAVPPALRQQRARTLLALGQRRRREVMRTRIGQPADVLCERLDAQGRMRGFSSDYLPYAISGLQASQRGQLRRVAASSLAGDLLLATALPG